MTEVSDNMIRKVQALMDKASSTEFPEERDALLAKADQLMAKYAIEQFQLDTARQARGEAQSFKVEDVTLSATGDQAENITEMIWRIGNVVGTKGIFTRTGKDLWGNVDNKWSVRFYGFPVDLQYLEMLHGILQIAIYREIDPRVDGTQSFDHNVYRLHEAGIKWREIARDVNAARFGVSASTGEQSATTQLWDAVPWPDGGRLIRAYKRECARLGVTSHAVMSSKGYRDSFVTAFASRILDRIQRSRQEVASEPGTALVLVNKNEKVHEAFNLAHPKTKALAKSKRGRMDSEGISRGYAAADRTDLGQTRINASGRKALS